MPQRGFPVVESLNSRPCFRGRALIRIALRRLACVARLDGLRAGHPPFPRRRRQGQHEDHDQLARHHAGDRYPDNRRHFPVAWLPDRGRYDFVPGLQPHRRAPVDCRR